MAAPSSIGRGTTVRGNVSGDGDLDIQGRVEGSVAVQGDLIIGEAALIKSDVSGRRVTVFGAVAGNVFAEESLVLERGARVVGDLGAPSIGIRPGALLRGHVSTGSGDGAAAARSRAASRGDSRHKAPPPRAAAPAARPAAKAAAAPAKAVDGAARAAMNASSQTKSAGAASMPKRAGGPPPPVVPSLKKGAKGALKRKAAR